jgi:hypothetical protein
VDNAKALRADIESAKATLGTRPVHRAEKQSREALLPGGFPQQVEAAINSLPSPDEPGASRFEEASVLASANVTWAMNCTISSASPWQT